jgi:hypothetical protein
MTCSLVWTVPIARPTFPSSTPAPASARGHLSTLRQVAQVSPLNIERRLGFASPGWMRFEKVLPKLENSLWQCRTATSMTMKLFLFLTTTLALSARADSVTFDSADAGKSPPGWTATKTGKGEPKWTVERDDSAPTKPNVLKQSGEAAYPVAFKDDTSLKDGMVEVKFKPVAGQEDQAAGVVWRVKDADNYYIARANALEDNVRIYHFVNGKRTQFKGANLKVSSGQWHTLRVESSGSTFKVFFDGKHLFDAENETFKDAGKVGVWTKADSVTLFDDFSYGMK